MLTEIMTVGFKGDSHGNDNQCLQRKVIVISIVCRCETPSPFISRWMPGRQVSTLDTTAAKTLSQFSLRKLIPYIWRLSPKPIFVFLIMKGEVPATSKSANTSPFTTWGPVLLYLKNPYKMLQGVHNEGNEKVSNTYNSISLN